MKRISDLMGESVCLERGEHELPDREALERMKTRTLKRIEGEKKDGWRRFSRPMAACAALLLLVLAGAALDLERLDYVVFSGSREQDRDWREELEYPLPERLGAYTLRSVSGKRISASETVPSEGMEAEYRTFSAVYLPEEDGEVDMATWDTLALEAGRMEGRLWAAYFGFDPETGEWIAWPEHPNYPDLIYSEPEITEYRGYTLYLSLCSFTVQETDAMGEPTGELITATDQNVLWLDEERGLCFRLTVPEQPEQQGLKYAKAVIDSACK